MNWKDSMAEWGGGEVSFLSEDGECIRFVVAGEPQLLESKYKQQTTQRIAAPLMTPDGFTLLIMGKRLARKLSKYESQFDSEAFIVIRHGEARDIDTTYELKALADDDLKAKLFGLLTTEFNEEMVADAIIAAKDIMSS